MKKNNLMAFLVILTVIGFGWGFYQASGNQHSEATLENIRSRAFYDLIDSVEKLSVLSAKTLVSHDDSIKAQLFSELNTEAYVAQENLCQLPIYHNSLLRTEKFLNQMGNFSFALHNKAADNKEITPEEINSLISLNKEVEKLSVSLHSLANNSENPFSQAAVKAGAKQIAKNKLSQSGAAYTTLSSISTDLEEVPSLTYDGPFSDELENVGTLKLEGEIVEWHTALDAAKTLLGSEYVYKAYGKSSENAGITVYSVSVANKKGVNIGYLDISRSGGFPVQYTANEPRGNEKITINQGISLAEEFIKKTCYKNMVSSYYIVEDNILTLNFLYNENNVSVYPDMIKVSVDLTNKKIAGFDCKTYLKNHKERDYKEMIISPEEARSKLGANIETFSEQIVIIPLKSGKEALCYEYKIKENNHEYLIYINATTGREENILTLVTTDKGTLTL
ncbi:MAG: germination protein YpeB [Clostridiales bacterium]